MSAKVSQIQMDLNEGMHVELGRIKGMIFGGPFRKYVPGTRRLIGVKMAAEIDHPHEISIPTEDFSIPEFNDMEQGMVHAITYMAEGYDVYAGCMGGIGRTGLFMGCMAKLMKDMGEPVYDPVKYVRHHYKAHAIETQEQQDFVRTFDTTYLQEFVTTLNAPRVEIREVVLSPWEWWLRFLGFGSRK